MRVYLVTLILAVFCTWCHAKDASASERPNILFCLADDWGWPHAGALGDKVVETPVFDRLAEEGVLFSRTFISSPSCTPSRNAVLTGQQFYRLGHGANLWSTLDVNEPTFMMLLREAGYEIGHFNKAWGPGNYSIGGYTEHPCGPEMSIEAFLKNRDTEKPFCFWLGTTDPHRAYVKGSGEESGIKVDDVHVPGFFPDTEEVRSDIADYYFEVQRWDSDVGRAIKQLESVGELENTIIVMTGDHGMPFPRCKGNLYDWGSRVPLAVRWGNQVKPGRVVEDFTSFTDFAPTFLDAAGVEVPGSMTGRSLLPVLTGRKDGPVGKKRDFVIFGRERHVPAQGKPSTVGYPSRGIRTDRWLLIMNLEPDRWPAGVPEGATHSIGKFADCDDGPTKSVVMECADDPVNGEFYELCFGKRPALELYDCGKDPDQVHNLADNPQFAGVVKELKEQLIEYLKKTEDPRFTGQPVLFDSYIYRP